MTTGPRRGGRRARLGLVCAGTLAACGARQAPRPPAQVEVLVTGCAEVWAGPACELPADGALQVWSSEPLTASLPLLVDGRPLAPATPPPAPVGGGWLQAFKVPATAQRISVGGPGAAAVWSMALARWREPPSVLREARALRRSGQATAAEELLRRARPGLAEPWGSRADALLARLAIDRFDLPAATQGLRRSATAASSAGRTSDAADDLSALAFLLIVHQQRYAEARGILEELAALTRFYPEGASDRLYFEGVLAARTGSWWLGIRSFRDAAAWAARIGLTDAELNAREQEAILLATLGRGEEAVAAERAVVAARPPSGSCASVDGVVNLAWVMFLAGSSAGSTGAAKESEKEEEALLRQADAAFTACGANPLRRYTARLNAVLAALGRGDVAAAGRLLDDLQPLAKGRTAAGALWELDARAELALATGQPRAALGWFERALDLAHAVAAPEAAWRAETGRGRALLALGRRAPGIAALRAAEADLEASLIVLPAGQGRDQYVATHEGGTRTLVAALLAAGQVGEAMAAARHARARVLRLAVQAGHISTLTPPERTRWYEALSAYQAERARLEAEASSSWTHATSEIGTWNVTRKLREERARRLLEDAYRILDRSPSAAVPSRQQLAGPEPDEVLLAYFPSDDGWLAFASEHGRAPRSVAIRAARPMLSGEALAASLLAPFAAELRRCARVRLLVTGELEAADLEALPWQGAPLGTTHDVARGLDLDASPPAADVAPAAGLLLVADPQSDLPAAEAEAGEVRAAMAGRSVTLLSEGGATRERLLGALPGTGILHFAGHAVFGGVDGMESGLRLAGGTRLLLGDLLAVQRVPPLVVLSACEAGRGAATPVSLGFGLAQAFVVGGARAVLAPVRPVNDELAHRMVVAFYRELSGSASFDYRRAVRGARSALAGQPDWSNFRLFVR